MPQGWQVTTVQAGESLDRLAQRHGVDASTLMRINGLPNASALVAGDPIIVPILREHVVSSGDTVSEVAQQYGVSRSTVIAMNYIEDPDRISAGQVLRLPPDSAVLAAATTTVRPSGPARTGPAPVDRRDVQPVEPVVADGNPAVVERRDVEVASLDPLGPNGAASNDAAIESPADPGLGVDAPWLEDLGPTDGGAGVVDGAGPAVEGLTGDGLAGLPGTAMPPARSGALFRWPVDGRLVANVGEADREQFNEGINIAAPRGTSILAADNGVVAYAGNELRGYGNLVLLRHADGWVTAYAHAEDILVSHGDRVQAGQRIATVGNSGAVSEPQLHFEIRRGSQSVNPLDHLPTEP